MFDVHRVLVQIHFQTIGVCVIVIILGLSRQRREGHLLNGGMQGTWHRFGDFPG